MPATQLLLPSDHQDELGATLELPADGHPKAYAIFVHCLENQASINSITCSLTQLGFGVITLDRQKEEASYRLISPEQLVSVTHHLAEQDKAVSLIIGHSLAGTTALLAAYAIDTLQALVTIATPIVPDQIKTNGSDKQARHTQAVLLGKEKVLLPDGWLDALQWAYDTATFKKISKPLLILHAVADSVVAVNHAAEIFQHTLHPKSFITLDDADHFLSRQQDAQYAGNMIAAWVPRYMITYAQSQLTSDKQVVTQTKSTFTTQIVADQHTLMADEPESAGGHDLGPDPYDLLVASLGACTGMTLRMYANHKKWPLEEVRVHLQHQKIYAEDCSECQEKNKIDHIERIIELEGPLDEQQKKRLIEIADKCPVHKTLSSAPSIVTTFREQKLDI